MPPKRSITLTEAELRLMKVIWARGESTVAELAAAVAEEHSLAYNSVLTTIRVLENKGYVQHRQEGRAFLYTACVAQGEAGLGEVHHVLHRFFQGSRERMLVSLLGNGDISAEELKRLKQAIDQASDDAEAAQDGAAR